ncbi:MAG: bifunctional demethylmenaquinone methyltransferase/2-methoxy-6-polyprenyl-1,4-benzoquinol methylase UbiE [Paludibacteraceae bacterium]
MDINKVKPYNQEEEKTSQLRRMFNGISGKYDKFNDIMSLGLARVWRKKALKTLTEFHPETILDIAAGTADLSIDAVNILHPKIIVGIDISEQMLEIGRSKIDDAGMSDIIRLQVQDVSSMTFENESFDTATTSFGIRNFEKLDQSLTEIHRILKPGGKLVILEMSEPQTPVIKQGYLLYTKTLIPFAVKTFANDPKAYSYLTHSVKAFPQGKALISILEKNRFKTLKYKTFFLGVCSLYVAEKVS